MDDSQNISLDNNQKSEWNNFQDHLAGEYPTALALKSYQEVNPKSTLTADHIPVAISDITAIKSNPDIDGLQPSYKAGNNFRYPVTSDGKHLDLGGNPSSIPKPDYNDPASRLKYAQQFSKKYGIGGLRGDTPLRINETPDEGSDTAKNLATKAAKPLGLDPALFYSSAMEEGMSGLFKDKNGESDFSGNKDYPTGGFHSFGLDDFTDKVPALIKKGYLPQDFKNQFIPHQQINEQGRKVNSADFKNPDVALQAKAAVVKDFQDQTEAYAKKKGIPLSDKAKQFFSLVAYNGGAGTMQKMIDEYKKRGLIENDKFIDVRPNDKATQAAYDHTAIRMKMSQALKSEGLF